jgi:hypothetical protein
MTVMERAVIPVFFIVFVVLAFYEGAQTALLFAIFAVVALIALFVQRGMNEIIKGLEALDRKLTREP